MSARLVLALGVAVAAALAAPGSARAGGTGAHVVVLANAESADSKAVAEHYAAKRRLPPGRICLVRAPAAAPELSLEQARAIERDLRVHLRREGLDDVRYLVLTPGIPVRVAVPGGWMSTTAFLMAIDTPLAGRLQPRVPDPAMASPIAPGPGAAPDLDAPVAGPGREGAPLRLATHLVGYTAEDAKALVDRGVASDHSFPKGLFAFQDANRPADFRDGQFDAAMEAVRALGADVERFPVGTPPAGKDVVVHLSGGAYSALTPEQIRANRYPPGAIADMLESFGAVPGNFVAGGSESQRSVAHYVAAGITGVHGAVQEPYAHVFPHALVAAKYRRGYDLAESFHATIPYLAWQNLVIGDPLAKPFAPRVTVEAKVEGTGARRRVVAKAATAREGARIAALSLWVDGRRVALERGLDGGEHAFDLDVDAWSDGPHEVRVVAEEGPPTQGGGEWVGEVAFHGTPGRVAGIVPGEGGTWDPREPVRVRCGDPATAAAAKPVLEARGADGSWKPLAASVRVEGSVALVAPASPPEPGAALRVRATAAAGPREATFSLAPRLALEASAAASKAGEEVVFRASGGGGPWTRPLFLRCDDPRARGTVPALVVPDAEGRFRVAFGRAGVRELAATDLETGAEASVRVTVAPGPPARVEVRCPSPVEVGAAVEVRVVAFDESDNRVPLGEAAVRIGGPGRDDSVAVPLPAEGTVEVRFERAGAAAVEAWVEGGPGDGMKDATDGEVEVLAPGLGPWVVAGPFASLAGKDAKAPLATVLDPKAFDPKRWSPAPGKVEDDGKGAAVWTVAPRSLVDLGAALPDPGGGGVRVVAAAARVRVEGSPADAVLALGAEGEAVAFWDGKRLEGETAAKGLRAEIVLPVRLTAGTHTLVVVVARSGRPGWLRAALRAPAGNDFPGASVVAPARGSAPDVKSATAAGDKGKPGTASVSVAFTAALDPRAATDPARWRVAVDGKPVDVAALDRRYDARARTVVLSNVPSRAGAAIEVTALSLRGADGSERTTSVTKTVRPR